ncbi:MAG: glycerol kinase GlpK, partial [Pyrinomonadaceae bacterium]|nr:glycerol kinase GlpK [Pyrinomonadaceae bacterium]
MAEGYVLAIDQGTTGTKVIIFDHDGNIKGWSYSEFTQYYPMPGWVEHDPGEIWSVSLRLVAEALQEANVQPRDLKAIGITNQRETAILWDRMSGKPIVPAIVWQDRRTAGVCDELKARGLEQTFRSKTGLVIDPYFSGTKIKWLLDHTPHLRTRAENGEIAFGTVDSWLVWNLTGGRVHVTDYSNASRTLLYNIYDLCWDEELLKILCVPQGLLPVVKPSAHVYARTDPSIFFGQSVPVAGIAGDQHAALFGQACYDKGLAKNTYGTGSFVLANAGTAVPRAPAGLLATVAWQIGLQTTYALEASIFVTGAAVQWLRDGLGIIESAAETETLAESVPDNAGVYFVPAFVGLGAPHWDMYARGAIVGLTGGVTRAHLARATLEAIAYQTRDVLEAMEADSSREVPVLRVDGGGTANGFLMQFQADQLGLPVETSAVQETTARGAAFLAGLAVGFWPDMDALAELASPGHRFEPR